MSDELKALQDTATQARAKADELKAALTDESSDEEHSTADEAEKATTEAESAFAEAQAKAAADAEAEAAAQAAAEVAALGGSDADASRTGFAEKGLHPGDECICPDRRKGTVHSFDAGLICIPNHDQG
jgi:hypothetical protein